MSDYSVLVSECFEQKISVTDLVLQLCRERIEVVSVTTNAIELYDVVSDEFQTYYRQDKEHDGYAEKVNIALSNAMNNSMVLRLGTFASEATSDDSFFEDFNPLGSEFAVVVTKVAKFKN